MEDRQKLSRRRFLQVSAVTAASAMVAACGGGTTQQPAAGGATAAPGAAAGATTAPAAPAAPAAANTAIPVLAATSTPVPAVAASAAKESPALKALVDAGSLPPVAERLPKNPYVVPHAWLMPGNYGGTLQVSAGWVEGIGAVVQQMQYGHSLLRYLKDGQEIGPGLVESWEKNDDSSQWTLHFREGLKWSDGQPWSTDDIMFWWEDMVTNDDYTSETPPDEARSGKNTLAQIKKVDDVTLQMIFDAPAPLTADRLAMWTNGNAGKPIGPTWMAPKHYVQQFHPKYTPSVSDFPKTFDLKSQYRINPECPTMTGWKLKSYEEGVRGVWERNPYYWAVDREGNQLPYIDGIVSTYYQDKEVQKLAVLDGKIDYDNWSSLTLSDVQALKGAEASGGFETRLWDSGSGTASVFFFSQDYKEEKMRNLIKMPEFRKALSMAYNREVAQKTIYYGTGELTTGTMSPKAIEYNIDDTGKSAYASWRDSASKYDPEAAKALLDQIGVKAGADGVRTMPDGSPLNISLDYAADAGPEHVNKNNLLVQDWKAIGVTATPNPIVPTSYDDQWKTGTVMSKTVWEVGDGPNHLVYPQWVVPIEFSRWAPLQGQFYNVRGTPAENEQQDVDPYERTPPRVAPDAGGPVEQLWKIYDQTKIEPDQTKRNQLVWDMIKIHVEQGPFFQGTVANYPRIIPVKKGLMNVPKREELALGGFVNPWIHPTPAVYDPESWFWDKPEEHA